MAKSAKSSVLNSDKEGVVHQTTVSQEFRICIEYLLEVFGLVFSEPDHALVDVLIDFLEINVLQDFRAIDLSAPELFIIAQLSVSALG